MTMPNIPGNLNETTVKQHTGIIHLAFGVDTHEEVEDKARQLKADGFKISFGHLFNLALRKANTIVG